MIGHRCGGIPTVASKRTDLTRTSSGADVASFLARVRAAPPPARRGAERGRLMFALDATASREPSWDQACRIQGEMFETTAALGGLEVQLCYYRGFFEFHTSRWVSDARALLGEMTGVRCRGGATQIARVLAHCAAECRTRQVNALVFVGDCMEEDVDLLCRRAGELGLLNVRAFLFHEGGDATAERAFREIARLTRGAYCRFDPSSAAQLRELLGAVAVYAAGGRRALEDLGRQRGEAVRRLVYQLD